MKFFAILALVVVLMSAVFVAAQNPPGAQQAADGYNQAKAAAEGVPGFGQFAAAAPNAPSG